MSFYNPIIDAMQFWDMGKAQEETMTNYEILEQLKTIKSHCEEMLREEDTINDWDRDIKALDKAIDLVVHHILDEEAVEENIENPSHYQIFDGLESVDVVRALQSKEEYMGWCEGNLLKYLFRWKKKNGLEDLKKARVYLNWLISEVE